MTHAVSPAICCRLILWQLYVLLCGVCPKCVTTMCLLLPGNIQCPFPAVPVPGGSMAAGCSSSHVCTPSLHFTSAPPPPPSGVAAAVSLSSNGQVTDILTHPAGKGGGGGDFFAVLAAGYIFSCLYGLSTAEIIRALGQQVDAKWKHFGVQLSVEPTLLDAVNKDNFGNTGDCMLDLVSKWVGRLEGTGNLPRTWQTVVEAVNNAGFEQLAKYLAKKYGVILPEE